MEVIVFEHFKRIYIFKDFRAEAEKLDAHLEFEIELSIIQSILQLKASLSHNSNHFCKNLEKLLKFHNVGRNLDHKIRFSINSIKVVGVRA